MATRKALGRGLSALIPPKPPAETPREPAATPAQARAADEAAEAAAEGAPLFIQISRIAPNPSQPRKQFRQEDLDSLAASIVEQGVLQPLVVRKRGDGYELIIGERRWRASQIAGLSEVPAVILDASDRQVIEMALVENVQRADLNPIELAEAFRVLTQDEGMTQEEAGRRVGLDRSSVANHLRLLELGRTVQQDLIDGRLTMGHAKAILQAPESQRQMLRDQIVRSGLTVRAAEELGRKMAGGSKSAGGRAGPKRDVHVVDLEERIRRDLQTKVRIVGRPGRGRLEIHYFSSDQLEQLTDRLLGGQH